MGAGQRRPAGSASTSKCIRRTRTSSSRPAPASYRSDDGGRTWTAIKGAPGGDDPQRLWINPLQPEIMLLTADQGATITTNGGRTWSSWYNQPTAQLYHVATDNQFPYWVYGGQQESGAIGIASRGNGGQISFRDWIGVGADEYAYVAPDPLNPDIVYGGRVQRFNRKTGQSQNVAPEALRSGKYRILRTMPLLFHPADPQMLLFATQRAVEDDDRRRAVGDHQSRPLARAAGRARERRRLPDAGPRHHAAARRDLRRRPVAEGRRHHLGRDRRRADPRDARRRARPGRNVTPPALRPWDKVSQLVAGHFDAKTAYAAVNAIRRDDMRPHVYRTHDGGTTWTRVVDGLPDMGPVNVVREDPKQPGLLFAGTERAVYVSVDDGERWLPLRQNMPATSIRDLVIHEDDLVVGTHGRSIWILDNIAPLRELAQAARAERAHLFGPPMATRVRWNMFSDTPFPPEEPAGANPPDGAILDYYLARAASDGGHRDPRRRPAASCGASRAATRRKRSTRARFPIPTYWFRPAQRIATSAGHHRVVWDLRYPPPPGAERSVLDRGRSSSNTPSGPVGPFVHPGTVPRPPDRGRRRVRAAARRAHGPACHHRAGRPAGTDGPVDGLLPRTTCGRRTLRDAIDAALNAGPGIDAARRSALAGAARRRHAGRSRHHLRQHLRRAGRQGNGRRPAGEAPAHAEPAAGGRREADDAGARGRAALQKTLAALEARWAAR